MLRVDLYNLVCGSLIRIELYAVRLRLALSAARFALPLPLMRVLARADFEPESLTLANAHALTPRRSEH